VPSTSNNGGCAHEFFLLGASFCRIFGCIRLLCSSTHRYLLRAAATFSVALIDRSMYEFDSHGGRQRDKTTRWWFWRSRGDVGVVHNGPASANWCSHKLPRLVQEV
jgi:hypothetical protein